MIHRDILFSKKRRNIKMKKLVHSNF